MENGQHTRQFKNTYIHKYTWTYSLTFDSITYVVLHLKINLTAILCEQTKGRSAAWHLEFFPSYSRTVG
jgi:hypothetical protein